MPSPVQFNELQLQLSLLPDVLDGGNGRLESHGSWLSLSRLFCGCLVIGHLLEFCATARCGPAVSVSILVSMPGVSALAVSTVVSEPKCSSCHRLESRVTAKCASAYYLESCVTARFAPAGIVSNLVSLPGVSALAVSTLVS